MKIKSGFNMSFGGWGRAAHIQTSLCRAREVTDGDQTTTGKDTRVVSVFPEP